MNNISNINSNADTQDIINRIIEVIEKHHGQARIRAKTPKDIWNVLKKIKYIEDAEAFKNWQLVKTPKRILQDGFGDCKSYAILGASVAIENRLPVELKFISYGTNSDYTHVYLIIDGIAVDACLDTLGKETNYKKHKIIDMNTQLATISKPMDTIEIDFLEAVESEGIGARKKRRWKVNIRKLAANSVKAINRVLPAASVAFGLPPFKLPNIKIKSEGKIKKFVEDEIKAGRADKLTAENFEAKAREITNDTAREESLLPTVQPPVIDEKLKVSPKQAFDVMGMLKNPLVLGGLGLLAVMLMMKKK